MGAFNLAIIVGSLRKESNNLKLAKAVAKLGHGQFTAKMVTIGDLPLFNEDLEKDVPASVKRLKSEIESADAVLFVTAEYNRGMPGVLKNAIDWASRPYGKNSFAGKPAALIGTSPGAIGTACSQHNLRPTLAYLDMIILSQPEVYLQFKPDLISADGEISDDHSKQFIQKFTDALISWTQRHMKSAVAKAA